MAHVSGDRILETTTTTGQGNITLAGAVAQYRPFSAVAGNGDTIYYVVQHETTSEWEVGLGTWQTGGLLARTEVHASSNSGNLVNLSAGTKLVYCSATTHELDAMRAAIAAEAGTRASADDALATAVQDEETARIAADDALSTSITNLNDSLGDLATLDTVDTAQIANDAVSNAKLRNSGACSVIGRNANISGNPGDISASSNDTLLRRTGDALDFGQITVGMIPNTTVTLAKLANIATARVIGRTTGGSGVPEELTLSNVLDMVGSAANGDILIRSGGSWTRLAAGTDSHVLTLTSGLPSWAAPSGGGSSNHVVAVKTADEDVTSSDAYQADDQLQVAMEANKIYRFESFVVMTGPAAGDAKVRFTGPAGATLHWTHDLDSTGAQTPSDSINNLGGLGVSPRLLCFRGCVVMGGTAGNLVCEWAQNASNGTATRMHIGSWLVALKLN